MGTVRGAEGIVHIDFGHRSQGLGEGFVVGFFLGVVAEVLKQQHLSRLKLAGHFAGNLADAVGRKANVDLLAEFFVQQFAQAVNHRAQRVLWIRLALGAAQVRGQYHLGLVLKRVNDGGQRSHDAGVVGNRRTIFGQRHVEIDADEDPLVGNVDIAN